MFKSYTILICLFGIALAVGLGCDANDTRDPDAGTGGTPGGGGTGGDGAAGTGGTAGGGGTGGDGGTGGTGGGTGGFPSGDVFTNALGCDDGISEDPVDCDYGCTALGNTFGFAAILNVITDDALTGGGEFAVGFDGFFVVSEAFIAGAEEALAGDLRTAVVRPGGEIPVTALSGATGDDVIVTLEEVTVDLDADSDGNTIPGPFPLPFVPKSGTFTFGTSGTDACFNLSTGIDFNFDITAFGTPVACPNGDADCSNLPGGFCNNDPTAPTCSVTTVVPGQFLCQPANQVLVNANNIDCPNGDSDCPAPSTCDAAAEPACEAVIQAEATAGEVCFTIPGTGGTGGGGGSGGAGGGSM